MLADLFKLIISLIILFLYIFRSLRFIHTSIIFYYYSIMFHTRVYWLSMSICLFLVCWCSKKYQTKKLRLLCSWKYKFDLEHVSQGSHVILLRVLCTIFRNCRNLGHLYILISVLKLWICHSRWRNTCSTLGTHPQKGNIRACTIRWPECLLIYSIWSISKYLF